MRLIALVCLFLLASCAKNNKSDLHYLQDYENAKGWTGISLESGFAYSGKYCQKVAPETEYSHGFNLTLAEISNERLKKIKAAVKITCQRPQEDIFLVIDIFSPGLNKSISYSSGQSLAAGLKNNNSWANCTNELSIPADASGKDIVKVYAWNPKHQLFFMDDLEVSFEK